MKTKPKDYNRQYLRNERLQQGLTVKELAERTGLNASTIIAYENGSRRPSVRCWRTLKEALEIPNMLTNTEECIPKPITFIFETGRSYTIKDAKSSSNPNGMISPPTGDWCIFKYAGKNGIHHVFTETRGGWKRTYTDAQLIGKKIEEAGV